MTPSDLARFIEKVDMSGPIPATRPDLGPCWQWTASVRRDGYGQFYIKGRNNAAHLVAYRHFVGVVKEGLEIDHVCRNRRCVNPAHLDQVTHQQNIQRGAGPAMLAAYNRSDVGRQTKRDRWARGSLIEGRVFSREARDRMGAAHRGKRLSDAHREKLREAWVLRKERSV